MGITNDLHNGQPQTRTLGPVRMLRISLLTTGKPAEQGMLRILFNTRTIIAHPDPEYPPGSRALEISTLR